VDLVLADLMMPGLSGLELCRHIKNCPNARDTPVVILLAATERKYLGQVYEAGACDYIMKPLDPLEVVARVRSVLRTKEEIDRRRARENQLETRNRELQAANQELLQLSLVDPVTGVANRRHFDEVMDRDWRSAARHQFEIGLIIMDIDFFKGYNDRLGHPAGDACLRRVANELAAGLLRPDDFLGRYGGEEFAVILPRTDLAGAAVVAERLRSNVESLDILHPTSSAAAHVTISQGLACVIPEPASTPLSLIAVADELLYEAKRSGRNQYV
jgi:diguanylate cyclase (GGDEF)-like protein